jgi:hypothetical protein
MAINFNVNPYYDDYDEDKGFHRILFKPGVAVQARELTQLQTILQKQIERVGRHFFEDGAMVIPGQIAIDTYVKSIKLTAASVGSTNLATLFDGQNKIIEGLTNGVEAIVLVGINAEGDDPATLIVRFTRNGNDFVTSEFQPSETIRIKGTSTTFVCAATNPISKSSIASIQEGVYYAAKSFVKVLNQTIALDKYSNTPSYRIGLSVSENIITELDDSSLYDNAIGSPNEAAPGADRYKIELVLTKLTLTSELDQDFYELARVEDGLILRAVNKTQYSVLEKTLARRTFDESGNYTVDPFRIQIREHRNNNRGAWAASTAYLRNDVVTYNGNTYVALTTATSTGSPPSHTVGAVTNGVKWLYNPRPYFNQGVYQNGDESKLAVGIEPGKAYINGYEVEKIATQYIPLDKARTTENLTSQRIDTLVGNYVLVSNVYMSGSSSLDLTTFSNVSLFNNITSVAGTAQGTKVGTASVRGLYFHSGNASLSNSIFKLSLFDINLEADKSFDRDVKQIQTFGFTADIALPYPRGAWTDRDFSDEYKEKDWYILEGTGNVATGSTTLTGSGTSFGLELKVGDYIYIDSTADLRQVTAIASDYSLTIESALTTGTSGSRLYRAQMPIKEQANLPVAFVMPYRSIKQITNPIYYVGATLKGSAVSPGNLVFSSNTLNSATKLNNFVVINTSTGRTQQPTEVVISGSTFTLTGLTTGQNYTVIAPVESTLTAKTKTTNIESKLITNNLIYSASEISLDRVDVYQLDGVKAISDTGNVDITNWYIFDNGQRASHYGVSKIIRKPGFPAPTSNIRIDYRYFSHSAGNYFDSSSYADINYENIPSLFSEGLSVKLTDAIDFRPVANITTGRYEVSYLPHRSRRTTLDYEHYLPRLDKITIDLRGNIYTINGAAAVVPSEPENHSSGMPIYKILLAPYTYNNKSPEVTPTLIDNKRYTMRDIGNLEKRLQSVEYYTALSLLEQDTASLSIKDSLGLERFKNGFIVDNFEGHGVGDVTSPDYRCSIDMERNELRPPFVMKNINLVEKTPAAADRIANGYQVTGDLVTLRYTHETLVDQSYASRTENVNPFAVAAFVGRIGLNPPSDEWFETHVRPEIVVNEEGNFDSVAASLTAAGVLGTVWNAWQTQWTGTPEIAATSVERLEKPYEAQPVAPPPRVEDPVRTIEETKRVQGPIVSQPEPVPEVISVPAEPPVYGGDAGGWEGNSDNQSSSGVADSSGLLGWGDLGDFGGFTSDAEASTDATADNGEAGIGSGPAGLGGSDAAGEASSADAAAAPGGEDGATDGATDGVDGGVGPDGADGDGADGDGADGDGGGGDGGDGGGE